MATEFPSAYPPQTHTHGDFLGDPDTHGRVQGCRGDGISIPIYTYPIPIPMGIPMGIPTPTADLLNVHRVVLLDATRPSTGTSPSRSAARRRGHRVLPVRAAAARRLAASADISCRRADRPTWRSARSGATGNRRFVGRRDVTRPRDVRDESASFAKRPPASGRALSTHARVVSRATWMYNVRRRPVASSTGNDVTPRQVRWITSSCREDAKKSRRSR